MDDVPFIVWGTDIPYRTDDFMEEAARLIVRDMYGSLARGSPAIVRVVEGKHEEKYHVCHRMSGFTVRISE